MKIACVLLAAGSSRRMEGANKLLLDAHGESVVHRAARMIRNAHFTERVIVTGHDREKIEDELFDLNLRCVYNPEFQSGMHSSIRVGLKNLREDYDFVAICLADQPALSSGDYDFLIGCAELAAPSRLIVPVNRGVRGNPVLISREFVPEILAEPDRDQGCRYLFERYPQDLFLIEMPSHASLIDVDTVDAYQSFRKDLAWK